MNRTALAVVDWFIPRSTTIKMAERGVARLFVSSHLLGPVLIQAIAVILFMADPEPSPASTTIMICVAAFWLLPFVLRLTANFELTALISVQLLCVTSLLGTTFYGGVSSPFLPWLLVSLMLGFFYLSNRALLILTLFSTNILVALLAHVFLIIPQHLSIADLGAVSWFSMFAATAYMSWMAIYYANIISSSSDLELQIESHRLAALRLRKDTEDAERVSRGKTIFIGKMGRQMAGPLSALVEASEMLLDRPTAAMTAPPAPELLKINEAGRRMRSLVVDILTVESPPDPDASDLRREAVATDRDGRQAARPAHSG